MTLVADLTLETPDEEQEYYRFVYNQQEMAAGLFKPNALEEYQLVAIIIALALAILLLFVVGCLFTKVFIPWYGRRNNLMVEENALETSKDK